MRLHAAAAVDELEWTVVGDASGALGVVLAEGGVAVKRGRLVAARTDDELVAAMRAHAARRSDAVNAIDVADAALCELTEHVVAAGAWWRASFWGIAPQFAGVMPSGASLHLGGDAWTNVVQLTQVADGVEARTSLRRDDVFVITTWAQLPMALERIARECSHAIAARAASRARSFSARLVAERLVDALGGEWSADVQERFPEPAWANIWRPHPLGGHFQTSLREEGDVVRVERRTLANLDDVQAALPALVAELRRRATELRPSHLRVGASYRVLQPFKGLAVGQRVTCTDADIDTSERAHARWTFDGRVVLGDDDWQIVRALHDYLALDSDA